MAIDSARRKLIEHEIRQLEELLKNARPGNPDIPRWQQEIKNKRAYLAN